MVVVQSFRWAFLPRFRRGAFGWRGSTLAVQRVRQAVAEICKVARKNPILAGEGAVRFFERVSGALEQIDSSSGAIGSAVYVAIEELVPIIASAPVEAKIRNAWLDRLWKAHEDDRIPYIESLTDHERYGLATGTRQTYLATFRAITKRYPQKDPRRILDDLVASTPGMEGKWFAAARQAGFLDTALRLAESSPCDPMTLTRAARDHGASDPDFAVGVGLAALRWISAGYGYELTGADVFMTARYAIEAARNAGRADEVNNRIRAMIAEEGSRPGGGPLSMFLGKDIGSV